MSGQFFQTSQPIDTMIQMRLDLFFEKAAHQRAKAGFRDKMLAATTIDLDNTDRTIRAEKSSTPGSPSLC